MQVIGIDIGGANVKISDGETSRTHPFPLWRQPQDLSAVLRDLLRSFGARHPLAITMTGELADCFETKAAGVRHILDAVESAADGREVHVWQMGGELVTLDEARELTSLVAAANWHALATWAGRMCPEGLGLVVDMGTTTVDLIPIADGVPSTRGCTDLERLASGELLYLGIRRTPLCALLQELPVRGGLVSVARELFASTWDVHLLLGHVAEEVDNCETANGRPATRAAAADRLARMVCADRQELTDDEILDLARYAYARELEIVVKGLQQATSRCQRTPQIVLLSGSGEFLAREALSRLAADWDNPTTLSLNDMLGPTHSQAACAFALARLGRERLRPQRGGSPPGETSPGTLSENRV